MGTSTKRPEVTIRKARTDDAFDLSTLLTQLGYPNKASFVIKKLQEFSELDSANVFVAEEEGNVIGFLSFVSHPSLHQEGKIGTIIAMCVLEGKRGSGIGTKLIHAAEQFAMETGCARMAVASGLQRIETHKFYRALGYEEKTKRFVKDF